MEILKNSTTSLNYVFIQPKGVTFKDINFMLIFRRCIIGPYNVLVLSPLGSDVFRISVVLLVQ